MFINFFEQFRFIKNVIIIHIREFYKALLHHCFALYIYEELWQGVAIINNNLSWPSPFFYYINTCSSVFVSFFFFNFFPRFVDEEGDEILILIWIWFIVQMMALTIWKKFWFRILNSWSWWGRRSVFPHCSVIPICFHFLVMLSFLLR